MSYIWKPSADRVQSSSLHSFTKYLGLNTKNDFEKLWRWSVENSENFWSKFWDFSRIIGDKGKIVIQKNKRFHKNVFFPDSKINYAENILKKKDKRNAISFLSESGYEDFISWEELYEKVCRLSFYLKKIGLKKGDRVAAYVPNKIETIISFFSRK